jgi:pyridoxal 5'-phosphate synthase pdxS subunit
MIRTKGEAGTGNVVEAVRHMRAIMGDIRMLRGLDRQEMTDYAREFEAPAALVIECAERGRLPVVNFSAGGIATPSDAALMMQARCGRGLCRLRDLQVLEPGAYGPGHCRGSEPFQ